MVVTVAWFCIQTYRFRMQKTLAPVKILSSPQHGFITARATGLSTLPIGLQKISLLHIVTATADVGLFGKNSRIYNQDNQNELLYTGS